MRFLDSVHVSNDSDGPARMSLACSAAVWTFLEDIMESVDDLIRRQPILSAMIALGTGVFFALVFKH